MLYQKRDKRVLDNWSRFTRGLLIRKRLQDKYDLTDPHKTKQPAASKKTTRKRTPANVSQVADVSTAWPLNRQAERSETVTSRRDKATPFPFEVETM